MSKAGLTENALLNKTINLQFFADNDGKTEKPTPKRRGKAREEGQVLQSKELSTSIVLIMLFISLRIFGGFMYQQLALYAKEVYVEYPKIEGLFTLNVITKIFIDAVIVLFKSTAPIFSIAIITGLLTWYAQVGLLFTTKPLGMKFSRINPLSGFKRLLSLRSFVELLKSIIKIVVIGFIVYSYLNGEKKHVLDTMEMPPINTAIYIATTSFNVALRICIALILLAILDYIYQRWDYEKSLMMSKEEIKEEHKQMEGNPEIKGKIKQKQRQISMQRMMKQVPKADVIITNPTHFAVAIKYDEKVSSAPIVLAKGQDFIALRIKEIGKEHKVEIVENKPLARTLYETVEIGQSIPAELYQAVAEVLAFVYNLKGNGRAG